MTRKESKHVAQVSLVVDIPINNCVRLLHLVPILLYQSTLRKVSEERRSHLHRSGSLSRIPAISQVLS